MNKLTAVEWLVSQIDNPKTLEWLKEEIKQAKELEKMQHQETFNQARLAKIFEKDMPPVWDSWYQYYNITFKSE
jgi:hypothetical protein